MTLISIKKTALVEPAPTGTVSLYVDSADSHLKQVDEAGAIIDLTDGSATSSPNMAQLINITLETLVVDVVGEGLINPKATYRITDAAQGVIRVFGKSATELTATAMLEGTDDGSGSITAGQWGNYDLDGDVFTPSATSGTWTPAVSNITSGGTVTVEGESFYQKVENVVTCSFRILMTPDTGNDGERFELTLPILPASNFAANNLVNGSFAVYAGGLPDINECYIKSKSGTKNLDITISTINIGTEVGVSIHVQYSI